MKIPIDGRHPLSASGASHRSAGITSLSFTSLPSVTVMAACHFVGVVTITSSVEGIPTSVEGIPTSVEGTFST